MLSRREFLAASAGGVATIAARDRSAKPQAARQALIAITLDLEMSRNFPTWEQTHWDFEKGNLNDETKKYSVEAARRVHKHGGRLHFFAVGRVFEQENVDWLKEIVKAGHPVGNHTYDHVNVTATKADAIQFRFNRSPWLIEGKTPRDVIGENIRLATAAIKSRLGVEPAGFRTPGGFADGLADRKDVQQMLLDQGFKWVSGKYPRHKMSEPGKAPDAGVFDDIVKAQAAAQPFAYPTGLVEVPMSPVSDIGAFRGGRWKLESFLQAIRQAVGWVIEHGAVFDFLGHPSCLCVTDPEFQVIELICKMVKDAGEKAKLATLDEIAGTVPPAKP